MNTAQTIFEEVKTMPEPFAQEVLDFIGYLKTKQDKVEINNLIMAQESVLTDIWDNEIDDKVWNDA